MSVFSFNCYVAYIREYLRQMRSQRGIKKKIAVAGGFHQSLLSQVLRGQVHLTLDQGYGLCIFWKFNDAETEFFLTLLKKERAASTAFRQKLQKDIQIQRKRSERIDTRLKKLSIQSLDHGNEWYYSAWMHSAVHMLLTTKLFRRSEQIALRLGISNSRVTSILQHLKRYGIAECSGNLWTAIQDNIHLSRDSPMVSIYHQNWRMLAMNEMEQGSLENIHYTSVQSVSAEERQKIKERILETIDESQEVAESENAEDLICTTIDFFTPRKQYT